jgi:hypothetical protein
MRCFAEAEAEAEREALQHRVDVKIVTDIEGLHHAHPER